MKKIIFILCLLFFFCKATVLADTLTHGSVVSRHTFEGYDLFYDYGSSVNCTDYSHSGKKSRMFDASQSSSINLHTNSIDVEPDKQYYAQVWVKGDNDNILYNKNSIWVTGPSYLNQKFLKPVYTDENGWTKYGVLFKTAKEQTSLRFVIYFDATNNPCENTFYFDDICIYTAPEKIVMDKIEADDIVNLNKVNIYGYNSEGNKTKMHVSDAFRWSVVSGNGSIDKYNNLVCNSETGDTIRVRAEAFGLMCEADVVFGGNIGIELVENSLRITNHKDVDTDTAVFLVLYDKNDRLYDISCVNASVPAYGSKEILIPEIYVSRELKGQRQNVIVLASDDMKMYELF